jgi:hypothetical protein
MLDQTVDRPVKLGNHSFKLIGVYLKRIQEVCMGDSQAQGWYRICSYYE